MGQEGRGRPRRYPADGSPWGAVLKARLLQVNSHALRPGSGKWHWAVGCLLNCERVCGKTCTPGAAVNVCSGAHRHRDTQAVHTGHMDTQSRTPEPEQARGQDQQGWRRAGPVGAARLWPGSNTAVARTRDQSQIGLSVSHSVRPPLPSLGQEEEQMPSGRGSWRGGLRMPFLPGPRDVNRG